MDCLRRKQKKKPVIVVTYREVNRWLRKKGVRRPTFQYLLSCVFERVPCAYITFSKIMDKIKYQKIPLSNFLCH